MFSTVIPSLGYLLIFVLVHDECRGLAGGVNNERVAVESLDHDSILCAEVVRWEGVRLPSQPLVCIREVLEGGGGGGGGDTGYSSRVMIGLSSRARDIIQKESQNASEPPSLVIS